MIRINSLHKYFNKGKNNEIHVINGVDLNLEERGMVAIFGKSGCGKTTLLNVIGGLDGFAEGRVEIDGNSISESTDDLRNKYVGYIFQNYNLNKAESCFDNVADALRLCGIEDEEIIRERVMAALANVGMEKYFKRTPDTLSGGQQQRIAIARAIVKNPRIILADEPTGNLDEANTVMIMDLLKAISKDHLVLLVTHEANLVDYYCDTVIELSDGKIIDVRNNSSANGFAARDKNAIYLGELEKTTVSSENADVEFYGPAPDSPIKLTIVNNGGHLYIKLGSSSVQMLDETSEIHLVNGVYEEKANENSVSESIDMSKLPRVEGTRFGHLFSFKSSVKSGYFENFKKRKKGKKLLTRCMLLFSAIIVLMTAIFGTAIGELIEIENAFNPNTFYVFASDAQTTHKLNAAVGDGQSGIDYFYLSNSIPDREMRFSFSPGNFESVTYNYYRYALESEAIMLPIGMDKELKLVCGNRDGLEKHDVLITTETADKLLESSGFEHITDYNDLIGMVSDSVIIEGKGIRIAGILKSKERVIYIDEYLIAQKTFADVFYNDLSLGVASDYGKELANGEAAVIVNFDDFKNNRKLPKVGESISVHGKSFKISDVDIVFGSYGKWLDYNGLTPVSMNQFLKELIKEKYPDYTPIQCDQAVEKAMSDPYYHYYFCSYYIEYYDEFIRANCKYGSLEPLPVWLYTEKGIEDMKYYFSGYYDLYRAEKFKELYGDYPTSDQHYSEEYQNIPEFEFVLESYVKEYIDEYNQSYTPYPVVETYALLVSKDDYIELSKIQGETYDFYGAFSSDDVYNIDYYEIVYAVIHSSDPELTDRYLNSEFSDLESPSYYYPAIATPESLHSDQLSLGIGKIVSRLIAMVTLLVLMSICMYFIMRSSLMNRIKETGIYRAIGVSKKNLVFKFFIEAMVLTTVTVFIGYILTSSFIFVCLGWSPFVKEIFFYPVWLAALVLIILYALSLFCGTLPILMLLRKTPSEILAKYDI